MLLLSRSHLGANFGEWISSWAFSKSAHETCVEAHRIRDSATNLSGPLLVELNLRADDRVVVLAVEVFDDQVGVAGQFDGQADDLAVETIG